MTIKSWKLGIANLSYSVLLDRVATILMVHMSKQSTVNTQQTKYISSISLNSWILVQTIPIQLYIYHAAICILYYDYTV